MNRRLETVGAGFGILEIPRESVPTRIAPWFELALTVGTAFLLAPLLVPVPRPPSLVPLFAL